MYNYFRFGKKQTSPILKFFFRFQPWPHTRNRHVILHQPVKCHLQQSNDVVSIFLHARLSGSILLPVLYLLSSLSSEGQSVSASQILCTWLFMADIWLLPLGEKKCLPYWNSTSDFDFDHTAIIRMILHKSAKLHPYWTTHCGNMRSYLCFKMAAAAAQYYFHFPVCWCHCVQKVKIYLKI